MISFFDLIKLSIKIARGTLIKTDIDKKKQARIEFIGWSDDNAYVTGTRA